MVAACPHNFGAVGEVPPQLFVELRTVMAGVHPVPKLEVVGHKGKLMEGNILVKGNWLLSENVYFLIIFKYDFGLNCSECNININ